MSATYKRINEDYLDKIEDDDMIVDDTAVDKDIRPGRWHNCLYFQLQDESTKRQFRQYRQMLDAILGRYLRDYDICVIPWSKAVLMDNNEFSFKVSSGQNGYTKEDTDVVFIQFNGTTEQISNMFVLKLFTFFYNAFKFDSQYRNFGSLNPKLTRLRDGKYTQPDKWTDNIGPWYRGLINHYMLRLGEALQDVVLLVSDPKKIKRSQKKKEEIAGFLDYVRITFDCDVI
jgi:hypothetical protein